MLPTGLMMVKRQRIIGSTLRARSVAAKSAVMDALRAEVWTHIESGSIKPIVDEVLPVQEAERAHALVAADQTFGKVVMTVGD